MMKKVVTVIVITAKTEKKISMSIKKKNFRRTILKTYDLLKQGGGDHIIRYS